MSKSEYFEEVEFEVTASPIAPVRPKTEIRVNPELIAVAIEEIKTEFAKIKTGDSDLTHYAVDNTTFGSPVGNALKRLETHPSVETIKAFVQLAGQDLGGMAQIHFRKVLGRTLEEVTIND